MPFLNYEVNLKLNSKVFSIPILDGLGYGNIEMSEKWMMDVIKIGHLIKSGAFVDIGVNVGQSLLKLKAVNEKIDYIGFEPNPICVNYVEKLIRINHFNNTILYPVGVSNKTEILELNFYSASATDSSASLDENFRPSAKIVSKKAVQVVNYDIIKSKIPERVGIVKIDVEGFELFVLQGIEELIVEKRPVILLEVLPVYNDSNEDRMNKQEQIEALVTRLNYKIARIIKGKDDTLKELNFIDSIGIHADLSMCDYFIFPEELETNLKALI